MSRVLQIGTLCSDLKLAKGQLLAYTHAMQLTAKNLLLQEMTRRRTRNSAYSMRAFARDLGVGVTTLSDVLADKRSLSKTNLEKVLEKLSVSPTEASELWSQHKEQHKKTIPLELSILEEDHFRFIADWYYLAILNLAKNENNRSSPSWIADRLSISPDLVREALKRLQRLGLLQVSGGRLVRTSQSLSTTVDIPSAAIRKHHSQNLEKAAHALENVEVNLREFGSVTMAVNMKNLPRAKEILFQARKKIGALLEEGPTSEVYTLSFQLFPVTKARTSNVEKENS